jgi:4-hydroxy-tetrahydrodipicolinate synthase
MQMGDLRSEADRRAILKALAAGAAVGLTPRPGMAAASRSRRLQGVFPIAFTPVTEDDRIDLAGLAAQVTFCQRGGVQGIAWPQIASGWTVLSETERLAGAQALIEAAKGGRTAVVIGVQSPDRAQTERYARQAERLGADAIICIPPAGMTDKAALLEYYQWVGKLTSLPLFAQAGDPMDVDLMVRMFETIPTFRHVKDEAGEPLVHITELRRRTHDQLHVFSGRGVKTMITEMELGFDGCCPFVSLADVYAAAYDLWHAGRKRDAFAHFAAIAAADRMFSESSIDVLIARGVFKPGTRTRMAPPAPGSTPANQYMPAHDPAQIRRILTQYLAPYLRA